MKSKSVSEVLKDLVPTRYKLATLRHVVMQLPYLGRLKRKEPIFIVGCGRSGTTMLLSILSADQSLYCISDETECFARMKSDSARALRFRLAYLNLCILRQRTPIVNQVRYVEKTPRHVRDIARIRKAYGGRVRFIHLVRDGRDVITSHHPSGGEKAYHIDAARWVRDVSCGVNDIDEPWMLTIRYEDIIQNFEASMARLYEFLGQSLPEEVRQFTAHATVRTHWAWPGEVRPLSASSIGRWQKPELSERAKTLTDLPVGRELLTRFDYL